MMLNNIYDFIYNILYNNFSTSLISLCVVLLCTGKDLVPYIARIATVMFCLFVVLYGACMYCIVLGGNHGGSVVLLKQ